MKNPLNASAIKVYDAMHPPSHVAEICVCIYRESREEIQKSTRGLMHLIDEDYQLGDRIIKGVSWFVDGYLNVTCEEDQYFHHLLNALKERGAGGSDTTRETKTYSERFPENLVTTTMTYRHVTICVHVKKGQRGKLSTEAIFYSILQEKYQCAGGQAFKVIAYHIDGDTEVLPQHFYEMHDAFADPIIDACGPIYIPAQASVSLNPILNWHGSAHFGAGAPYNSQFLTFRLHLGLETYCFRLLFGAFSAYRLTTSIEDCLKTMEAPACSLLDANRYLTEDQLKTVCILKNGGKVVVSTKFQCSTGVPETLNDLMKQRRRWQNGGWVNGFSFFQLFNQSLSQRSFCASWCYFLNLFDICILYPLQNFTSLFICVYMTSLNRFWISLLSDEEERNFSMASYVICVTFFAIVPLIYFHGRKAEDRSICFCWTYIILTSTLCLTGSLAILLHYHHLWIWALGMIANYAFIKAIPMIFYTSFYQYLLVIFKTMISWPCATIGVLYNMDSIANFHDVNWGIRETIEDDSDYAHYDSKVSRKLIFGMITILLLMCFTAPDEIFVGWMSINIAFELIIWLTGVLLVLRNYIIACCVK